MPRLSTRRCGNWGTGPARSLGRLPRVRMSVIRDRRKANCRPYKIAADAKARMIRRSETERASRPARDRRLGRTFDSWLSMFGAVRAGYRNRATIKTA